MRVEPASHPGRRPLFFLGAVLLLLVIGVDASLGASTPPKYLAGKITGKVTGLSSIKYCKSPTGTIKFGSNFELSGPLSAFGSSSAQGVAVAVNEMNSKGGVVVAGKCYKIDLTQQDDRSDAATAVAQIRGLVNDDGIRYIFGPSVGSLALLTAAVTQAPNPPAINISGGGLWELNGLIGTQADRGLFKTSLGQQTVADLFAHSIKKAYPKAKTIYVLFRNDSTGVAVNKTVLIAMKKVKIKVIGDDLFPAGTTDFSSFIGRVQAAKPDVLYYGYIPTDDITITRQLVQLGLNTPLAVWQGQVSMALSTAVGHPVPNSFLALYDGEQLENPLLPQTAAARDRIAKYFPITSNSFFALWQYDYAYMIIRSMELAGTTTNTDAIRTKMLNIRWNGAQGPICWNKIQNIVTGLDSALVTPNGKQTTWYHEPFDVTQCRPQH